VTGKLIADLRKQMRLSPKEFADALGVSLPSVRRWEGSLGTLNLYTRQFEALARIHASAEK
jgi:DNA-binding transcriptional regulator YiaG